MEPERKNVPPLNTSSNNSAANIDDTKSNSLPSNYSRESFVATSEPVNKDCTASPGFMSSQIGETDEDGFDEADGESEDQEVQSMPSTSSVKTSTTLGMNEYEIRAQQTALAMEYTQLASILSQVLEKRVSLTLKKLNQLEAKEQREKRDRNEHRSGGEKTKNKYSEETEVYKLGKMLSYQISLIRANSRKEALIIWRDFYRQRIDLRERMSYEHNQRIHKLKFEHDHASIAKATDIPVMDWITANLDTVHYLRTQQPLASVEDEDAACDIQLMRGKGGIPQNPTQCSSTAIADSESEEDSSKVDGLEDVNDSEKDRSMNEEASNFNVSLPKKLKTDISESKGIEETVQRTPSASAVASSASGAEIVPPQVSQIGVHSSPNGPPLERTNSEDTTANSANSRLVRKSLGRKRTSSGLSNKTEISVLPSAMQPRQKYDNGKGASFGHTRSESSSNVNLPSSVQILQPDNVSYQTSSNPQSQKELNFELKPPHSCDTMEPPREDQSIQSKSSNGQPKGLANGYPNVISNGGSNVSQNFNHIHQGSPQDAQRVPAQGSAPQPTPHGHIIGMPGGPQYMVAHQSRQSPQQSYVPVQVMSPSTMPAQINPQIYASQILLHGGYQYFPGYPVVQGYPQFQYVAQAHNIPSQQAPQGYVYAYPDQWQGYAVQPTTGSQPWQPQYTVPPQP